MKPAIVERPILFSGPMILALLAGRKTMTRRVIKPQPILAPLYSHSGESYVMAPGQKERYEVGMKLWVRETWKPHCEGPISDEFPLGTCVKYRADDKCVKPTMWTTEQGFWCEAREESTRWRPSIFMPRWASRITLEIVSVRVERVQDINDDDAIAEGVYTQAQLRRDGQAVNLFRQLWDSLNAKRGFGWDKNPWVWVITFKQANK